MSFCKLKKIVFMISMLITNNLFAEAVYALSTDSHDLIPADNNAFYYQMGGGKSAALPAYEGAMSIPLHVESDVGLGYNCGTFNPMLSIINSLNAIQNSFQNIEQTVINNATSAITEFPMYLIARADPSLYNLLNNGLLGARKDLELSTKSCQVMQSELAKGQNPYANWATLSLGNDWKYHMSLTGENRQKTFTPSDVANGDINLVKKAVEKDNGINGIPWVHGSNIGRNARYAGGENQPPIMVIHDTVIAGYNVILQSNRAYDDSTVPQRTNSNIHLIEAFPSPNSAANWMTNIIGEEKITTYGGGNKESSAGVGLLSDDQSLMNTIVSNLQALVSGKTSPAIENLQKVSAPGVMINSAVINAIKVQSPVSQAIIINKLSQEAATAQLIDKALLARQILEEGSQVPAIYANPAAQESLKKALNRLNQDIENLLFNVKVRKALVSETAAQLLNQAQQQQIHHTIIQPNTASAPVMNQGAIPISKDKNISNENTL